MGQDDATEQKLQERLLASSNLYKQDVTASASLLFFKFCQGKGIDWRRLMQFCSSCKGSCCPLPSMFTQTNLLIGAG